MVVEGVRKTPTCLPAECSVTCRAQVTFKQLDVAAAILSQTIASFNSDITRRNTSHSQTRKITPYLFDCSEEPQAIGREGLQGRKADRSIGRRCKYQSYKSKGIWRQGIGSFVRTSYVSKLMPCRHMPSLVHFWKCWAQPRVGSIYIYIYICMCVYIYIYIYIH